jgi:3-oxoacyl-[acyl-carrier protein] reductase
MGVPQQTVYAATEALDRVWATELGHVYGITINAVAPGLVATEMNLQATKGLWIQ